MATSTILGPDGRPMELRATLRSLEEPQSAQVGAIRLEWEKHPARGLTPARLASIMQRAERGDLLDQLDLAEDMEERDAHLYAELGKRRGAITALGWSIEEPDKATAEEEALTERVRDWVGMLTADANGVTGGMDLLINAMTAAVLPGFAPIELQWQMQMDATGKAVRVPHCTLQPHRWFTVSADRRRLLLRSNTEMTSGQQLPGAYLPPVPGVELRPYAWLMHVHPARAGYVSRMSLTRVLAWPYLFKNYSVRDLAEFLEIYGIPPRIGRYPSGSSDGDKLTLLEAVTSLGHNAAAIMPQGMALDFMEFARGTVDPFTAMWDRMDAAESKAILGQTLSASEGSKGSHALGKVHEQVRMDIRAADARLYEESFTRQVIGPLCALNVAGVNMRRLPRLVIDTGEAEDIEVYADQLPKLAKAGLKISVKWVHDKLRIPMAEDGEETLQAPEPPPAGTPGLPGAAPGASRPAPGTRPSPNAALAAALAAAMQPEPKPDLVDELTAELAGEWQAMLGPLVQPLLAEMEKAVAQGESLQAFAARVPELVRLMDAQAATQALAYASFNARLAGEADVDLDR